ncbi:MAG: 3-dehydroquinate synthase [Deltaproteobacteria bacterium]|nr:3-dehydroquinate synthase [Deltaproteobacteria bacterium]
MRPILRVEPSVGDAYPVYLGDDLSSVWQRNWQRAVLIADRTTDRLFGETIRQALPAGSLTQVVSVGESSKSRAVKARIEDAMLAAGVDRHACVVALGGGVVLDLAGLVAATYLRGIDHVNVATTLLAQVDGAIGGKTAVNTRHGKNLIGAFHHPRAVLLHGDALNHLPDLELRNGLAELIKHAVIGDEDLFASLERWAAQTDGLRPPDDIIAQSVAFKAAVVAEDARDQGKRHILNFGHTVAHAIEHASNHAVAHGQAVAMGMVVEARLAVEEGSFPEADLARLVALLDRLGLPTAASLPFAVGRRHLALDKKTAAGAVHCAIPYRMGQMAPDAEGRWARPVDPAALAAAWDAEG